MGRLNAAHQFLRTLAITFGIAAVGAITLAVVDARTGDVETVRDLLSGDEMLVPAELLESIGDGYTIAHTTGVVTLASAPQPDAPVTAGYEFDVPVRFDTDHMAVTIETYQLHVWQQIPIVELRA